MTQLFLPATVLHSTNLVPGQRSPDASIPCTLRNGRSNGAELEVQWEYSADQGEISTFT